MSIFTRKEKHWLLIYKTMSLFKIVVFPFDLEINSIVWRSVYALFLYILKTYFKYGRDKYELLHDKTNTVTVRPVWSESSLALNE